MSKKTDRLRVIDQTASRASSGAGEVLSSTASGVAPIALPGPPESLQLDSNTVGRSAQTATARVQVSWRPPGGVPAVSYLLEVATNSGFTAIIYQNALSDRTATIDLPVGLTVWVRVFAQSQGTLSGASNVITFTTATDSSASAQPTSFSAAFIAAGDLSLTWTNPTSENFRDVEVRIWESASKVTLLHTGYSAAPPYVWTAAQNRAAGSGTPDPVVYIELRARTWAGVLNSTSPPSATATKSLPGNPSGLATDFTGADLIVTWTAATDVASYRLTLDGVARTVVGGRFVYTFDQNRSEHSGTADPAITVSLVGVDALDQVSATPATASATNAAPSAPSSVTLTAGFFTSFAVSVTATEPADFATYRWRIIQTSPSASDVTFDSQATLQTRVVAANATYQVGVRVVDVFGQTSAETLSSATGVDGMMLSDFRRDISYRDSLGTAAATLDAMKDGVTASGGVAYAA